MHYYKRNLGDYAKKAGRLSMLQHGSYTLLIDACYDREQFPTMEEAIEWTWASTTEEIEAVQFVLRKFFVLEGGVYVQTRIREELEEYRQKAETNKRIATERETNRKAKSTNRAPVVNEAPPNHKPITINQEPITINQVKPKPTADKPAVDGSFETFWLAYPKRKAKGDAEKAWAKVRDKPQTLQLILKALAWQTTSAAWEKDDGQFIPYPASYLNSKGWLDDPPIQNKNKLTPIGRKSVEATTRWLESQEVLHEKYG